MELFTSGLVVAPDLRQRGPESNMSETYIIEVGSQAAGIVVRTPKGYRFFAAHHRFMPLEGRLFRTPGEAERAAVRLAGSDTLVA